MRRLAPVLLFLVLSASFAWVHLPRRDAPPPAPAAREQAREERGERGGGPERLREDLERVNYPYGAILPVERTLEMWNEVQSLPSEKELPDFDSVNSWEMIGPNYMQTPGGTRFTGRVTDIEVVGGANPRVRVASASGGVWRFYLGPIPMTESLPSQWIGSFATHPADENTMIVGTGENRLHGGAGLYKTTDGGQTWVRKTLSAEPAGYYRIRYAPNGTTVHAASTSGYYRSSDGGETWNRILTTETTDLAIKPLNPQILYATLWGQGLWRSVDGGLSWTQMATPGIPTTGMNRGAVTWTAANTLYTYVLFSRADNNQFMGVYRTTDGGNSWTSLAVPWELMWGQGTYNCVISASPANANLVLAGGGMLIRSTNGGSNWTDASAANGWQLHADYHAITWNSTGTDVWVGNDGGYVHSADAGLTFDSSANFLPITQYYHIDTGVSNDNVIAGGSQDNGTSMTTDGGVSWRYLDGLDGSSTVIDPNSTNRIWVSWGAPFDRHRTTNGGSTWTAINNGIVPPVGDGFIRDDYVNPVYVFTSNGSYVYYSSNYGDVWAKLNTTAFPAPVNELEVGRYNPPHAIVYASLNSSVAGMKLRVYEEPNWYERSTGLPAGAYVGRVVTFPFDTSTAWALMLGLGTPGAKVYKTTNRGQTWTNITGDLPNVALSDIVPHPLDPNRLYLGTRVGCYRTTNGGASWHRWNNGMPEAVEVLELATIDHIGQTGEFFVIAGTHGRSMWKREVAGDDPAAVADGGSARSARRPALIRNYPNPFHARTAIEFSLPAAADVELKVYDVGGRLVATLVDERLERGSHQVAFDGSRLPAGAYYCRLEAGGSVATREMVLAR